MERSLPEALRVDAVSLHLIDIRQAPLDQLHALSIAVGWPHRAEDWQFLRETGHGVAALDEIDRVLGSGMWFPQGDRFATIGMMIISPRLQMLGTGQWLMQWLLADAAGREFRLNATRAARRLYLSQDFVPEQTLYQCQGEARTVPDLPAPLGDVGRLLPSDLDRLVMLDGQAFGVARPALLARLLPLSSGYGLWRDGDLVGFALCRRFGRGHVIGPVVAAQDADAVALVARHLLDLEGQFARVDTHHDQGPFAAFLARAGLSVYDTVLTMANGPGARLVPPQPGQPHTYGLVSQALG